MGQKTIPELDAVTTLTDSALIPVDTGIQTKKITLGNFKNTLNIPQEGIFNYLLDVYVATLVAGEDIVEGKAVSVELDAGEYKIFKANASNKNFCLGIAVADADSGDPVKVRSIGPIALTGVLATKKYYVDTDGDLTTSPGGGAKLVGQAIADDVLFVKIGSDVEFPAGLLFVKTHGRSVPNDNTTPTATVDHFDFTTWSAGNNDSVSRASAGIGEGSLGGLYHLIDGHATGSTTAVLTNRVYDKNTWSAGSNRTTAKNLHGQCRVDDGTFASVGGAPADGNIDEYDGTTWSIPDVIASGQINNYARAAFQQGDSAHWVGGYDGIIRAAHDVWDGSTPTTATAAPITGTWSGSSRVADTMGHMSGGEAGGTTAYTWDGANWSAALTTSYAPQYENAGATFTSQPASGYNPDSENAYVTNGASSSSTPVNNTDEFDGVTYSSVAASTTSRASCSGGVL